MKYSNYIFLLALSLLTFFSSCKKDEISETKETIEEPTPTTSSTNALVAQMQVSTTNMDGLDLGCFSVDFPFDLDVDGTVVTITDNDSYNAVFNDPVMYIDYVYPINITYPDETTATIEDGEALGNAFASCIPDTGWNENLFPAFLITDLNSCYDLVYPLSLQDIFTGTVYTANSESEMIDLIANYPDLFFEFPFDLVDADGNTATATNEDELFTLLLECNDINPGGGTPSDSTGCWYFYFPTDDCWDYVYPFDMLDQNGNTVTINNQDDVYNAMLNGDVLQYIFPVTIVNPDGDELVANDLAELEQAWWGCDVPGSGSGSGGGTSITELFLPDLLWHSDVTDMTGFECYSLNYPLEYYNCQAPDVMEVLVDQAAAEEYFMTFFGECAFVQLPVTITTIATGEQITFENEFEFFDFLANCQ